MADPSSVAFVDLAASHAEIADEVTAGFAEVMGRTAFINGPALKAFEAEYAAWTGVAHVMGVANGTDALELALRAVGVGPGDEVIVPAMTFVATAEAALRTGADVVLAEVSPNTLLLDPASVVEQLTPRTKAVMPVHLYGQMAPMAALAAALADAGRSDVAVVEDAAQSQGATQDGVPSGGFGVVTGTSFYPGKNLGAYGDGGAVLSNDDAVAARIRMLRDHGSAKKYVHETWGCTSRLDDLQAVVLSAKLRRLAGWNEARRAAAARYAELLADLEGVAGLDLPTVAEGNVAVWHLYVVQVDGRDRVLDEMAAAGVGVGIHYPFAVHQTPAYAHLGKPGQFPVAEACGARLLSLPMHPHLTAGDQERVAAALRAAVRAT